MSQIACKTLEYLQVFATQLTNALSSKYSYQVQTAVEKYISAAIDESDNSGWHKLLPIFIKIFIFSTNYEPLFKTYYLILKEFQLAKTKEKYECLILAIMDLCEKHYFSAYCYFTKTSKDDPDSSLDTIVAFKNCPGLKTTLLLLRKAVYKYKYQGPECTSILADISIKVIDDLFLRKSSRTGQKTYQISFKQYLLDELTTIIFLKYRYQTTIVANSLLEEMGKFKDRQTAICLYLLKQFRMQTDFYSPIIVKLRTPPRLPKDYEEIFLGTFCLTALLTLTKTNEYQFMSRSRCLIALCPLPLKYPTNNLSGSLYRMFGTLLLHPSTDSSTSNELLYYDIIRLSALDPLTQQLTLWKELYSSPNLWKLMTPRCSAYFIFLAWNTIKTKVIRHQTNQYYILGQKIASILNRTLQQSESKQLLTDIYFCMQMTMPLAQFHDIICYQQQKLSNISPMSTTNTFCKIQSMIVSVTSSYNWEYLKNDINQYVLTIVSRGYTLLEMANFIYELVFMPMAEKSEYLQTNITYTNQVSLALLKYLNIVTQHQRQVPPTLCTFQIQRKSLKNEIILYVFSLLNTNLSYHEYNSFSIALQRLFSIHYNRLNEVILRKWIVNRQYLLIHCLILCNLKVKNLCEQLIRLVSDNNELQAIFVKVDAAIVREYVEYLATKDKFKFRLALFEAECQHYQYLLYEYPLKLII